MLSLISKKLSTALKVIGGVLVASALFTLGMFAGNKIWGNKKLTKENQALKQQIKVMEEDEKQRWKKAKDALNIAKRTFKDAGGERNKQKIESNSSSFSDSYTYTSGDDD